MVAEAYFSRKLFVDYFSLDLVTEEIKIYSAAVNSKAFKRDIKFAVAILREYAKLSCQLCQTC